MVPNYALNHMYQLRGMASTLCIQTTISPQQWQPWTVFCPHWGLLAWHSRQINERGSLRIKDP